MRKSSPKAGSTAKKIALVGISAATIECGKLVLSGIPNVEVVTLLCALYGYVFGGLGVISVYVFVCIEPLIWGIGTWLPHYFIYWPLVSFVFLLLGRKKIQSRTLMTLAAVILTVFFGILSALIDVGLFSGYFDNFLSRFSIYYLRGVPFYLSQIITNALLFPTLFLPLAKRLQRINSGEWLGAP